MNIKQQNSAAFIIIKGRGELGLHYIKSASKSFISFIISENKRKVILENMLLHFRKNILN